MSSHSRLSWDFFGPASEGTARHFARHLEGFMTQHKLPFRATLELHQGATSVHLVVPEAEVTRLAAALRPRRLEALPSQETASSELAADEGSAAVPLDSNGVGKV